MPYNYLIDEKIRRSLNLDWEQTIIIFDEAHNIAQATEDVTSFDLSEKTLLECEKELDQLFAALKNQQKFAEADSQLESNAYGLTLLKEITSNFYNFIMRIDKNNYDASKSI